MPLFGRRKAHIRISFLNLNLHLTRNLRHLLQPHLPPADIRQPDSYLISCHYLPPNFHCTPARRTATACAATQAVKAHPTPIELTIGTTKLVPPAANKHLARLRLALAAALRSGKMSTR
ncbi:major facilitator superfamily transporter [Colletotrichum asianum]